MNVKKKAVYSKGALLHLQYNFRYIGAATFGPKYPSRFCSKSKNYTFTSLKLSRPNGFKNKAVQKVMITYWWWLDHQEYTTYLLYHTLSYKEGRDISTFKGPQKCLGLLTIVTASKISQRKRIKFSRFYQKIISWFKTHWN